MDWKAVLTSIRFWVAVIALVVAIAASFGVSLPQKELLELAAAVIAALGGITAGYVLKEKRLL